jgi:N-formylmaleamate deformylase
MNIASGWKECDVAVNGVRLHYYRTGRGDKPPIVLTHGFTDDGLCWIQVARELESDYDVIMPDMRGHGISARAAPGDKVDMAADLAGLVRELLLEDPILCGHSMGAMTSFQAAVRFPGLARALILEDPPWWIAPWPVNPDPDAENPIVAWAKSLPSQSLESLLLGYKKDHPTWPDELIQAMCESKKRLDPGIAELMSPRMNSEEGHWTKTIGSLSCPTLVVTADPALGGIVTPEVAARIPALNSRVSVVNVPGVGHLIRFDAFRAFMTALEEFLAGLE